MVPAKLEQSSLPPLAERFVVQGENEIFVELDDGFRFGLVPPSSSSSCWRRSGLSSSTRASLRKRDDSSRPAAQQLGERIARLIFQRQFFLPPEEQLAKALFYLLVSRLGPRIEAKPLVRIRGIVSAPPVPFSRVVREAGPEN